MPNRNDARSDLKEGGKESRKADTYIRFSEKHPTAKEPVGLHDIIFVYSRHVETVVLMSRVEK